MTTYEKNRVNEFKLRYPLHSEGKSEKYILAMADFIEAARNEFGTGIPAYLNAYRGFDCLTCSASSICDDRVAIFNDIPNGNGNVSLFIMKGHLENGA